MLAVLFPILFLGKGMEFAFSLNVQSFPRGGGVPFPFSGLFTTPYLFEMGRPVLNALYRARSWKRGLFTGLFCQSQQPPALTAVAEGNSCCLSTEEKADSGCRSVGRAPGLILDPPLSRAGLPVPHSHQALQLLQRPLGRRPVLTLVPVKPPPSSPLTAPLHQQQRQTLQVKQVVQICQLAEKCQPWRNPICLSKLETGSERHAQACFRG